MRRLVVILLLIGIQPWALAQSGFEFEAKKNKITIPFRLINNLIFVPVKVNGVELNFLLDSGVEETILLSLEDKAEVRFNNVQKIKLKGLGDNEAIEGLRSSKNILSFDGLTDRNHEVYIVLDQDFNFSSHVGIPVNGIIGYHFFKNHMVEINYSKKKIIVYKDDKALKPKTRNRFDSFPISIERNKPYITAQATFSLQDIDAKLLVDLGNSDAVWIFDKPERNVRMPEPNFEDYLGRGFSGDINGRRAKITSFSINGFEFLSPIVSFPDSLSIKSVSMVPNRLGSVGGEILKRFNLIFDYPNQKLYLQKSSHFGEPFTYNKSGIELQNEGMQWVQETVKLNTVHQVIGFDNTGERTDNQFKYKFSLKPVYTIASVRKNSPAQMSGLQAGDTVLSINGRETYLYSLQKINELLRAEEGKIIYISVEREGKPLKFSFELKDIL
ncbi:PDZ domain-containing protein [Flavobacterium sp. CYK-4]|uniref:PDZ domain-containing protein n=1 Tax=Flavobacterium lotistagni TaxID=2709660 RepID=UPI00140A95D4|nr:PDZ domain-containing protein [Flavobacterium lotistagni]NHM08262.1 PDZ domain-containing protein [Flavobacterium lotistagni]